MARKEKFKGFSKVDKERFEKAKVRDSEIQKRIISIVNEHMKNQLLGSYNENGLTFKEIFCRIQGLPLLLIYKKKSSIGRFVQIYNAYDGCHIDITPEAKKICENMQDEQIAEGVMNHYHHLKNIKKYYPSEIAYYPLNKWDANKVNTSLKRSIKKMVKRGLLVTDYKSDYQLGKKIELFSIP